MGKRRTRAPRRNATRRRPPLWIVNDEAAPTAGTEEAIPPPIGPVASSLLAEIAAAHDPLSAELVLCHVFRATQTAMPGGPDDQDRSEMLTQLLGEVIDHAEALASADALALLRVCSVLGPDSNRAAASDSASRLAAAGVPDRPWASLVGHPRLLQAWRYGDIFQEQESVGALFDYAGRDHAMMVLIDHSLGGGVKDGWVAAGRRARDMRNRVASEMATRSEAIFEDLGPAAMVDTLGAALARPPCPVQPDQVEDVAAYLDLIRSRVDHLRRLDIQ
ncbi:hypothetical protein BH23ACT6_BH23ACT6_08520 [soil metagenome]